MAKATLLTFGDLAPNAREVKKPFPRDRCDPSNFFGKQATAVARSKGLFYHRTDVLQTVGVFADEEHALEGLDAVSSPAHEACMRAEILASAGGQTRITPLAAPPLEDMNVHAAQYSLLGGNPFAGELEIELFSLQADRVVSSVAMVSFSKPPAPSVRNRLVRKAAKRLEDASG